MRRPTGLIRVLAIAVSTIVCAVCLGLFATHYYLYGQSSSAGFPEGYDAVQAAPASHKVVFEN
ncbi:MAG: hypothetical protein WA815_08990, partial [Terracidiphilus sp.]